MARCRHVMLSGFAIALGLLWAACATTSAQRLEDGKGEVLSASIRRTSSGDEKVTEFDLNGDKKADVWTYTATVKDADGKSVERLVRKELDLNWDGKIDMTRTYDDKEQIVQEALDMDFDGKIDQINYFEKGVIVRKERDMMASGRPTCWLFYEKGKLVRKEKDTNTDGKVDYWEYWEGDQVDRVGEDLDGDGTVDKWTKNPNGN